MCSVGGRAARHQEQGKLAIHRGRHHKPIGLVTSRYQALMPAHLPRTAHLACRGLAFVQVVASAFFMVGQHQQSLATRQAGQPFGFQVFGGKSLQHRRADPGVCQRFHHHAATQLFHGHHALGGPHGHAAISVLHIQTAQTQLGHGLVGAGRKTTSGHHAAAFVKAVGLVHPFAHRVAQLRLFV